MEAMVKQRSHSVEFKRQVAQEFLAGETVHGLAKRHDISRNLIRVSLLRAPRRRSFPNSSLRIPARLGPERGERW
jgi:transposase-like protein